METDEIDVEKTLFCGQTFAWERDGNAFLAVLDGRSIRISQETIDLQCETDPFLRHYFDMDWEYGKAFRHLDALGGPVSRAARYGRGLHILNQDPWETLVGFILSQNNNIKRIGMLYRRLSETYGPQVAPGLHAFPAPVDLEGVSEQDLRSLGIGFRAPYLVDAAANHAVLARIPSLPFDEALEVLQTIKGVGRKVGSCVLLYAYHRMEAFPMDTWMRKVMARWYPGKDGSFFFPYAALAQQYLFHYARTGGLDL
jgi:N-glycosylase/DNA lyase